MNSLYDRIFRKIGCEDLPDKLLKLSGSDLNSLLLEIFRIQAGKSTAMAVAGNHSQNRFTQPSAIDPVKYHRLEAELLEYAGNHGLTPVLLSPVAPLGSCSAFGFVSQNNVISAARGVEVLADPTNMLTLIVADRRKSMVNPDKSIEHYCTTARVARAQNFSGKNSFAHFGMFCRVSCGTDTGSYGCESSLLTNQLAYYVQLFEEKFHFTVSITLRSRTGHKDSKGFFGKMCSIIQTMIPTVPIEIESVQQDNEYYRGLNFKLYTNIQGEKIEIGDGGFVDWMQQITGQKKERCLISGIGLDRLMLLD